MLDRLSSAWREGSVGVTAYVRDEDGFCDVLLYRAITKVQVCLVLCCGSVLYPFKALVLASAAVFGGRGTGM